MSPTGSLLPPLVAACYENEATGDPQGSCPVCVQGFHGVWRGRDTAARPSPSPGSVKHLHLRLTKPVTERSSNCHPYVTKWINTW
jgi:hypothetical protein